MFMKLGSAGPLRLVLLTLIVTLACLSLLAAPATGDVEPDRGNVTSFDSANGTVDAILLLNTTTATHTEPDAGFHPSVEGHASILEDTPGVEVKRSYWVVDAVLVEVDTSVKPIETLVRDPVVDDAIANTRIELERTTMSQPAHPTDLNTSTATAGSPYSGSPPGSRSAATHTKTTPSAGVDNIRAPMVWNHYGNGTDVTVAVLDSGVDPDHQDIELYTDDPQDPTYPGGWAEFHPETAERINGSEPFDPNGHGTHVTGTVAGGDASGTAIGVAPGVKTIHAKVTDSEGRGSISTALAAMEWALENDADIITMSLGGPTADIWIPAVESAVDEGAIVVAASGNGGPGTSFSPGDLYSVVGVGAVDNSGEVAEFSSGETVQTESRWGSSSPDHWPETYIVPDVSAPGVSVFSAAPGTSDEYTSSSGTSMAAPHVAGTAGLIHASTHTTASSELIVESLTATARHPDGETKDSRYGSGIVDAFAATMYANNNSLLTGTVTTTNGEPVTGAVVEVNGSNTTTDADGTYSILVDAGSVPVTVTSEVVSSNTTVSVERGTEHKHDIELSGFGVSITDEPSDTIIAGEPLEIQASVSDIEAVSLSVDEESTAKESRLSPSVNGSPTSFVTPTEFETLSDQEFTITIDTDPNTVGTLSYQIVFTGENDTLTYAGTAIIKPENSAVSLPNQSTDTTAIRVDAAHADEPFAVGIYNSMNGTSGDRLGTSRTLHSDGVEEHITIRLNSSMSVTETVHAKILIDGETVLVGGESVLDDAKITFVEQHESQVSYETYYAVTNGDPNLRAADITRAIGSIKDGNDVNDTHVPARDVTRLIGYLIEG